MRLLIKNIKYLIQTESKSKLWVSGEEMAKIGTIPDAFLLMEDGIIKDFGAMKDLSPEHRRLEDHQVGVIDASRKFVLPSFCDSHTHLVYAGSREQEYSDKIRGLSYEEIAGRGGGILNSAKKLHEAS